MKLNICTINVRTLKYDEYVMEMEKAIEKFKWDVIGMCEVRRMGEEIYERKTGHILYSMGVVKGTAGVGFWINKKLKSSIRQFWGKSDRVASVILQLNNEERLAIIQVYAPTESATLTAKRRFYEDLEKVLLKLQSKSDNIIVMGDFNSKIGQRKEEDGHIMGRYGYGERNGSGIMLVNFAKRHQLYISNTFSSKTKGGRWTWRPPSGKYRNMIDYILINSKSMNEGSQTETVNKLEMSTDHRMVKTTLMIDIKVVKRNDGIKYENVEIFCDNIKQILVKTFAEREINHDAYMFQFSHQTRELIKKRETLKRQPGAKNNKEFLNIYKKIRKGIKNDIIKHEKELIEKTFEETGSIKIVKERLNYGIQWITHLRNKNDHLERDRERIMELATNFYESFYGSRIRFKKIKQETYENEHAEEIQDIEDKEIQIAIKSLNKNESSDGVTRLMLRKMIPEEYKQIKNLFNTILQMEEIPRQWKSFVVTLEYRGNDRDQIEDYRPEMALANLYKIFATIIKNRIKDQLNNVKLTEQVGYMKRYSFLDHLHILNQIIEKHKHYNIDVHIAFIKFSNAYDCLEHIIVQEALTELGIQNKYKKLVQEIHKNCTAKLKLENEGRTFALERGVRWGDPLSQSLLAVTLERVFRNLKWKEKGIMVESKRLSNLRFVENVTLFAEEGPKLKNMLQELLEESKKVGLTMNCSDITLLSNKRSPDIEIEGTAIKYKDKAIYLDQLISFQARMDQEIARRIDKTREVFASLKQILTSQISETLKAKMFNNYIIPVLTYGAQTWTLNKKQTRKLEKEQESILTTIIRNINDIDTIDVVEKCKRLKWNWAGCVGRMDKGRWTYMTTMWIPKNVNRRRGVAVKWSDEIEKVVGEEWWREAENKKHWEKNKIKFVKNT
ncbi:hypothetical protein ILUMI_09361 [Ignelater luminosus]|uniref:Endonuclease-reverse transcriptase n=1 Tax=Ignelater luminosus TaxID=2038154 RepID=A0A8K0CZW6_IGNLU|nr:hypothetical protein ILUMI_09361 [Ignelater luminosus]